MPEKHFRPMSDRLLDLEILKAATEAEIERLKTEGEIAPEGCWIVGFFSQGKGGGIHLMGLKQKLSPNIAQTGFIGSKYVTIMG